MKSKSSADTSEEICYDPPPCLFAKDVTVSFDCPVCKQPCSFPFHEVDIDKVYYGRDEPSSIEVTVKCPHCSKEFEPIR